MSANFICKLRACAAASRIIIMSKIVKQTTNGMNEWQAIENV